MLLDWQQSHYNVMINFLQYLNANSNGFILKGGTALMLCYNLSRFSEDIDLDCAHYDKKSIEWIVESFCSSNNLQYRIAKNTDTVKRFMIHYGGNKPLKVEVSYRRNNISPEEYGYVNNILVYTIQSMAMFKLNAYLGRDKIRDLYDVIFIFKYYIKVLPKSVVTQLQYAIGQKGLQYFDYVIKTQSDSLIDNDKLASDFLELYFYLGFK